MRHRRLAKLAEQNHDDEIALKSYQHSIKWGLNSCHESEQDYFNYARKAADVTKGDQTSDAKMILKQANTFLDRARKRYADRPEVTAQAQMVETQLLLSEGKEDKAAESAQKAKQLYNGLSAPNLETSLEFARTLHALDEEDEAREVLAQLAARHENNAEVMQIIDGITGEPISDTGKQVAAKLTKQGIGSYEQKNFETAISVFEEALFTYPKHVGLNLNLIQAILADTEATGCQDKYEKLCRKCLRAVGNIPPDHKQHKRYAFLYKQLEKHYPAALI